VGVPRGRDVDGASAACAVHGAEQRTLWPGDEATPGHAVGGIQQDAEEGTEEGKQARRLRIALAATGLLGIGYEVLVVRVLAQVAENTVYTFALLLAVYLVGTSIG